MTRGLVISDLHLFSPRSVGSEVMATVMNEAATADVLVLNGDIVDFRWAIFPDEESTIAAALAWLEKLIDRFEGDSIYYLLGNHDCLTNFRVRLEELALTHPALSCHHDRVVLNRNLFLHGDCTNHKMDGEALRQYRLAWSNDRRRGKLGRALYQAADRTGLSRRFHDWHFPTEATVARLAHHLDHVMPAWREEVDHCYFGHTHRPFSNHSHEGVLFHNTGSGIRGMGFQPLTFTPGTETH